MPSDVPVFIGRSAELAALSEAFLDRPEPSPAVVIAGPGGIGKTWLALRWAHRHRDRYPDGQLYVNLRGFDPSGQPVSLDSALRGFLDALGVPASATPSEPDAQIGLYRSLMADRRMLVVLDNARDDDQVAALLPGSSTCAVIVTSRDRLTGLISRHGADALSLDVLGDADARELLIRRLGHERLDAEPGAAALLVAACGGLPLALGITAARAAVAPHLALVVIAKELGDAGTRLGALDEDHPQASLRAVLSWSYVALTRPQARVFALLGLAPGPDLSLGAIAVLTGLPVIEVRELLRALQRQSLIGQQAAGRWRMHDLVRLYASEQAERDIPAAERERTMRRYADFYVHTAIDADRWLNPLRTPMPGERPSGPACSAELANEAEALTWLAAEHASLLAVQQLAVERGWHDAVWRLAWALSSFHRRRGYLHAEYAVWRAALPAAQRMGDPVVEGEARRAIGEAYALVGRNADAAEHLHRALELAERAGNAYDQARTHRALGYAYQVQEAHGQAFHHLVRALRLARAINHEVRTIDVLSSIGWVAALLGRYRPARGWLEEALVLARERGHREVEVATLHSLGYVAHHTDQPAEALRHYGLALGMLRDLSHTYLEAALYEHMGDSHAALGDDDRAHEAWRKALDRYRSQHRIADAGRMAGRLAIAGRVG
jgi:tetratricopeptide (TPR) repeat protein